MVTTRLNETIPTVIFTAGSPFALQAIAHMKRLATIAGCLADAEELAKAYSVFKKYSDDLKPTPETYDFVAVKQKKAEKESSK
jgi:hypothetical protein